MSSYRNIAIIKYDMGASKSILFSSQQNKIADMAKAMGHPARIAILEYLIKIKACVCGDIVNELPLAQATVSRHLKELKSAGLIKGTIEGKNICYCINPEAALVLSDFINGITQDCCITDFCKT